MLKPLLLSVLVLLGCSTSPKNPPQFRSGQFSALVRLYINYGGRDRFFCTGTIISNKYLLTAAHCIADLPSDDIIIKSAEGLDTHVIAKPAGIGRQFDLAILKGDFAAFKHIKLETNGTKLIKSWRKSKYVRACGFPAGSALLCADLENRAPYVFYWMSPKAALYPGMSGGPVIDLETKKIIGVNSAMGPEAAFFTPTIELFKILDIND